MDFSSVFNPGTWFQVKKDNLRANWQTLEDYLAVKLDCTITSWLKITYKGLKRLMSVFISYLDVTTDLILLGTVWAVLAGTSYLDNQFAYQVAIILLVSIVIPLLTSAIMIASSQPFVVMKALAWKKLTKNHTDFEIGFVKSIVMAFFPFVPALIIIGKENAIDKRKSLRDKNYKKEDLVSTSVLKECQLLTDYINECSAAQLTIKRNELSLELIVQLSIHLTMVLLSQTDYSLESGLQSIFQESKGTSTTWWYFSGLQAVFQEIEEQYNTNFWFFVFSVVWSFKTCAKTSIKIKTQIKTFLPMSAKLLLFFRYLFLFLIRVVCIVTYHAPYIGLLGLLNHYTAETKPLDCDIWKSFGELLERMIEKNST